MPAARAEVLIVEGETLVAHDVAPNLERLGYRVVGYARSTDELLQRVQEAPPDLVLMDVKLEGKTDGVTAATLLRETSDVPVVFVTSHSTPQVIERAQTVGAYGFLAKPVDDRELEATLGIAMNQHRQSRSDHTQREELRQQVYDTTLALGDTRQEIQTLSHHLLSVQDDERRRIARELHDDLGQRTALLGLKIAALIEEASPALLPRMMSIQDDVTQVAKGLREVSHRLHPSIVEDLGIAPALQALVDEMRGEDAAITEQIEPCGRLSIEASTALYRIAQEALRNAQKHADGSPITLRLWDTGTVVCLRVQDYGVGFSASDALQGGGLGLISMQERAHLVGGTLTISSVPNEGTTVEVSMPLPSAHRSAEPCSV